jgi:hypothetical protein
MLIGIKFTKASMIEQNIKLILAYAPSKSTNAWKNYSTPKWLLAHLDMQSLEIKRIIISTTSAIYKQFASNELTFIISGSGAGHL